MFPAAAVQPSYTQCWDDRERQRPRPSYVETSVIKWKPPTFVVLLKINCSLWFTENLAWSPDMPVYFCRLHFSATCQNLTGTGLPCIIQYISYNIRYKIHKLCTIEQLLVIIIEYRLTFVVFCCHLLVCLAHSSMCHRSWWKVVSYFFGSNREYIYSNTILRC